MKHDHPPFGTGDLPLSVTRLLNLFDRHLFHHHVLRRPILAVARNFGNLRDHILTFDELEGGSPNKRALLNVFFSIIATRQ
jgi:hypothetical protein